MIKYTFLHLVFMFFIYAFLGWCGEVAFAAIKTGKFVNRGFLNGPVCPIYGFGFVAVILLLTPVEEHIFLLFFASMLVTTFLEFMTGWVLEKVFHMRWWDYSQQRFNIGGYVCLEFSLLWGFAAVFMLKIIHPIIYRFISAFPHTPAIVLLSVFTCSALIDLIWTVAAINKLQKRLVLIGGIASDMREFSDLLGGAISESVLHTYGAAVETKEMYSELRQMVEAHRAEEKALADKNRAEEQQLLSSIRTVGKERRERYDALKKKKLEAFTSSSPSLNRIIKAFPTMQVYGSERALAELREYIESKKMSDDDQQ